MLKLVQDLLDRRRPLPVVLNAHAPQAQPRLEVSNAEGRFGFHQRAQHFGGKTLEKVGAAGARVSHHDIAVEIAPG